MHFSQHPLNLALRFALEVLALVVVGYWGWHVGDGVLRIFGAIGLPTIFGAIWGIFSTPGDTRGQGKAVIAIPGKARLILELVLLYVPVALLFQLNQSTYAIALLIITTVQWLLSVDRIKKLWNLPK
jgi:F0F1-type ATP synthase assembly protein I